MPAQRKYKAARETGRLSLIMLITRFGAISTDFQIDPSPSHCLPIRDMPNDLFTRRLPLWLKIAVFASAIAVTGQLQAQTMEWIWQSATAKDNEVRFFRKQFNLESKPKRAVLTIAADDEAEIWVNGKQEKVVKGWNSPTTVELFNLKPGANVIALKGTSQAGDAAFIGKLELTISRKNTITLVTDTSWKAAANEEKGWQNLDFNQSKWAAAISRGPAGSKPWGDVMKVTKATAAEQITVLPGYKIELMHSAEPQEGSWICMTKDPKGRLIISPQQDTAPMFRVTLSSSGKIVKKENIPAAVRTCMGLCWANNSLYANGVGPQGTGLYRLTDKNRNDQFDTNEVELVSLFKGAGEHGHHAVQQGADGKLYVMNGNHTKVPDLVEPTSPHRNYDEDFLLPRQWDAGGHAVGVLAPGGYVVRTGNEGKSWELMLAGFRNSYDFDFDAEGEMFTFDSDMEWEWGMPWYKPTRILHCVSAAEFGWRSGSGKWPAYYADSLPAAVDIGIGSPTGVKFGTGSNFPDKYKRAFYAMDWSYGRIVAVHLKPEGASYTGTYEEFVKGKPLNVTDLEFGTDGAMYFITGGRNTQAGLYRVSYTGGKQKAPKKSEAENYATKAAKSARELRRILESFHGKKMPEAVEIAWPHMGDSDRFIRYAARVAVESQDITLWKERVLNETNADAGLNGLLALARVGGKSTQNDLLMALKKFPLDGLTEQQKLTKLRVIQLSFIRQGKPEPQLAKLAAEKLNAQYPAKTEALNRELSQLLIFLEAPGVVEKTLALLDKAQTVEEQTHYILHLRNLKTGWTIEQRRKYFEWFAKDKSQLKHSAALVQWFTEVGREYSDGASYSKQLANMKKDAIANLSEAKKAELADLITDPSQAPAAPAPVKERKFVKEWKMADIEPMLDQVGAGRKFESGKSAFNDAQCLTCHRFGNEGGSVGPELTAAASKYSRRDILEAILEPSKVVSEQYQNFVLIKKDGEDVSGRIVDENADKVVVQTNPLDPGSRVEVRTSDIAQRKPALLSPMPEALVNSFTKDEVLDLLAYIESVGKAKAANFKAK
jgi:putative heme-binding domain-containing protein